MSLLSPVRRIMSDPFGLPLGLGKSKLMGAFAKAAFRDVGCRLGCYDDLTCIASRYRTDKGITLYPFHGYTRHYHRVFSPLRHRPIAILEIGVARKRDRHDPRVSCPSLELWAEYFPQATIVGLDIDDFSMVRQQRTTIFRGDQGEERDLRQVTAVFPKLDIIIDDGSHASFHQQQALKTLWPYLTPGGIYAIEDLDEQPVGLEASLPERPKTRDLLKDPSAVHKLIAEDSDIHLFGSPLRGAADTIAFIVKRSS